jgi:hypothetical protein
MLISFIHRWLTGPTEKFFSARNLFWFSLSLIFGAIFGVMALQEAFSQNYVVQDDARQHITWLFRFWDEDLFRGDFIADYYLSSLPFGYTTLYQLLAKVGIDPILASKLLPIILGVLTSVYSFLLALEILPVPTVGFLSTVLINYMQWNTPILVSATPRAFSALFFLAFLYYLLRRSLWPCLAAILLQGLFYPPYVLIIAGILALRALRWQRGWPSLSLEPNNYWLCGTGLIVAILVLLPYVLSPSEYGPTVTPAQAKTMIEFQPGGRTAFFGNSFENYWFFKGKRSSLQFQQIFNPPIIWLGLFLPILMNFPARFPLAKRVNPGVNILTQMIVVSLGLFFAAHAILFKLYLPNRYAQGLDFALRIATAIAIVIILDALFLQLQNWFADSKNSGSQLSFQRQLFVQVVAVILAATVLTYPSFLLVPKNWYVYGDEPQLYEFLTRQPKDSLTASLAHEASNLPSFTQRSVLVAPEFAIAYELGYYNQFRSLAIDLIDAQYSENLETIKTFINKYGVDFWLLERDSFSPDYIRRNSWLNPFQPATEEALQKLEQGSVPVLTNLKEQCTVFENEKLLLLEAKCILQSSL